MDGLDRKLLVLWTTDDKETARQMVFLYTENALTQDWWDEVTLLIWGSSAELVAEDPHIQSYLARLQEAGVRTIACRTCAKNLQVVEDLEALDIDVFYTGELLTEWLQSERQVLSV